MRPWSLVRVALVPVALGATLTGAPAHTGSAVPYSRADGAALSIVGTPVDSHVAPPGHYALVVLDGARTPSVAKVVHVG